MSDDRTDAELVRRARGGDDEALRCLYERHEGLARARIERRLPAALRRRVSVADVLQETLVVAHRRLPEFVDEEAGLFGAWLAAIAENEARDAVRRHLLTGKRAAGREVARGDRPDTHAFPGREASPSDAAVASETAARAVEALAALEPDHRSVLELVQRDGLTLREAADRLGRSHDATKKLYARALAKLAQRLGTRRTP